MEAVALTFAIIGFVFGVVAISQVGSLKKEMRRLRKRVEGDSDR